MNTPYVLNPNRLHPSEILRPPLERGLHLTPAANVLKHPNLPHPAHILRPPAERERERGLHLTPAVNHQGAVGRVESLPWHTCVRGLIHNSASSHRRKTSLRSRNYLAVCVAAEAQGAT